MKQALIKEILELKDEAIAYDFDWPTKSTPEDLENASFEDLEAFLEEVLGFINDAECADHMEGLED